ncbi:MAG: septum formation protein Maf [Spirochaetes bacterium]|nr:septum formation protein Maf [Spirochaetota bacterium]
MHIILGSSSPRRKQILGGLADGFSIAHPEIDETPLAAELPEAFAVRIAEEKCRAILNSDAMGEYPALAITADTIVAIDDSVIGKPAGFEDAVAMISRLNGRTHRVITALTLCSAEGADERKIRTGIETTEVTFKRLDREGIVRYLGSIDYRDKAGSYAFQENGSMIVAGFRGSATNIIGFPLRLFFAMLADMGLAGSLFHI